MLSQTLHGAVWSGHLSGDAPATAGTHSLCHCHGCWESWVCSPLLLVHLALAPTKH